MKTNDEILEQLSCCTIEEDADLDVKENFYYKYEDVIKAMNEARKQVNGDSMGSGQSNIPDVSGMCEHPWASVIGDGEMKPAKCLKCGKYL